MSVGEALQRRRRSTAASSTWIRPTNRQRRRCDAGATPMGTAGGQTAWRLCQVLEEDGRGPCPRVVSWLSRLLLWFGRDWSVYCPLRDSRFGRSRLRPHVLLVYAVETADIGPGTTVILPFQGCRRSRLKSCSWDTSGVVAGAGLVVAHPDLAGPGAATTIKVRDGRLAWCLPVCGADGPRPRTGWRRPRP